MPQVKKGTETLQEIKIPGFTIKLDRFDNLKADLNNHSDVKLLHYIANNLQTDYHVNLSTETKTKLVKELGLAFSTLNKSVKSLKTKKILLKSTDNVPCTTFKVDSTVIQKTK
jgi:hypothetical protein